jgi:hypothetical protein
MNTTTNTAEMNLTKGNGCYNITVDGTYVGWTYKSADGFWNVRIASTKGYDFEDRKAVVTGCDTRSQALRYFTHWLNDNRYFLVLRQEREATDAAADAWLASV